jgi:ABC-type transporter MlaC component
MKVTMKSILILVGLIGLPIFTIAQSNPEQFLDDRAQEMVNVIVRNQSLYASDPKQFQAKINTIFEPMVDFRRVGNITYQHQKISAYASLLSSKHPYSILTLPR